MSIARETKRNRKVVRALVRLKHSLDADDEIEAFLLAQQQALTRGETLQLEMDLTDILGKS